MVWDEMDKVGGSSTSKVEGGEFGVGEEILDKKTFSKLKVEAVGLSKEMKEGIVVDIGRGREEST